MSDEKKSPPMPAPGKRFVLHYPNTASSYQASISMPDGYTEQYSTGKRKRSEAQTAAIQRVKVLYRERNLPTPLAARKQTGELSPYLALKRKRRGEGPLQPGPLPLEMPTATAQVAEDGWSAGVAKIEDRFAKAFYRIQGLLLMGLAADPDDFLEHVRAIVLQATLGVETKSRIPYGTGPRAKSKRRERPPGS